MEIYLLLIAAIPALISFTALYYANHKAAEHKASLASVTTQLYKVNRTKDMLAKHVNELTTNSTDLQNEMNIAIGRLEHLDRILKTKTTAARRSSEELNNLLTITSNLRKELKTSHERIQHLRSVCIDLRTELKAVSKRLPPTPRGDF